MTDRLEVGPMQDPPLYLTCVPSFFMASAGRQLPDRTRVKHPPNCFWRSRGRHGDIAVGSEVQRDVADTRVMVSDIHRNVVTQSQGGAENQRRSVSNVRTPIHHRANAHLCPDPK